MKLQNFLMFIHPFLAVILVFPLIGIVIYFAWETRQRRLEIKAGNKSKIPPLVGKTHVQIGKTLTGAVVGVTLIGLGHPLITKNIIANKLWETNLFLLIFLVLIILFSIASLVFLYKARLPLWRGIFATLTGMGIVIIGCQDGIFRRSNEWHISHYYYGITASLLMIFSLAIIDDIYKDKSNLWRNIHIILNCIAILFFMGLAFTGVRDLFEIGFYSK